MTPADVEAFGALFREGAKGFAHWLAEATGRHDEVDMLINQDLQTLEAVIADRATQRREQAH
jgi:hypothetical protein